MTRQEKNDYQKAWRRRQSPEKQEQIRQVIRDWFDAHREQQNAVRMVRYYTDPIGHAVVIERGLARIKADPVAFSEWKEKRRLRKRARIRGITEEQWLQLLEDTGFRCSYCNKQFSESLAPEPDHIVSVSMGGSRTLDNITPSCRSCNAKKQNKPADVFRAEMQEGTLPK